MKLFVAYIITAVVFLVIDYIWLGVLMKDYFQTQLSHLMAEEVNLAIAAIFYLVFAAGIVLFCVAPAFEAGSIMKAAFLGACLGFLAYGTYDVTNMATLRNWPVMMSVIDVSWGTAITAVSAAAGYGLTNWLYSS
jgi:uncharacterized membrane protein